MAFPPESVTGTAWMHAVEEVRRMKLSVDSIISFCPSVVVAGVTGELEHWLLDACDSDDDEDRDALVADKICEASLFLLKGAIEVVKAAEGSRIEKFKAALFEEFAILPCPACVPSTSRSVVRMGRRRSG